MTSRTMRTQLHPSGTKASSGVFEDQEQRDFQKTFITQRVHWMCWHNAKWYKNQYSFILNWRDFAHFDNILSAGSHHPDNFIPPFQSWQFIGTKKYCQRWRYIQPHKLNSRPVHKNLFWVFQKCKADLCFIWLKHKQMLENVFRWNFAPSLSSRNHLFYKPEYMGQSCLN